MPPAMIAAPLAARGGYQQYSDVTSDAAHALIARSSNSAGRVKLPPAVAPPPLNLQPEGSDCTEQQRGR